MGYGGKKKTSFAVSFFPNNKKLILTQRYALHFSPLFFNIQIHWLFSFPDFHAFTFSKAKKIQKANIVLAFGWCLRSAGISFSDEWRRERNTKWLWVDENSFRCFIFLLFRRLSWIRYFSVKWVFTAADFFFFSLSSLWTAKEQALFDMFLNGGSW